MSAAPDRLGKYEFQRFLGKGNIGEVWKARDLSNKRDVALKTIYADLQRSDPQFLTRFITDGQVLVALRHANLVPTLEVNFTRQEQSNEITAYLVMEYIVGQTFASYLQNTSHQSNFPALSAIINFFTSLGLALDYAYQREIVHGNLTPDNILLSQQDTSHFPGGEPMLADIGLTQILGLATNTPTKAPFYLSPEQAQGYPPSPRSDVYALGVILYEIYTGTVPFRGESSIDVISQHMRTLPTPPTLINPIIPTALSEVILRAIAKDPNARYPNVSTFATAISGASTRQSLFSLKEQQPSKNITPPNHQENSLLGVAQPPPQPRSSQFRHSSRPSLSGLTPWGISEQIPALPSTLASPSSETQAIMSNPLPSETNQAARSTQTQLPAVQPQSTATSPSPVSQVQESPIPSPDANISQPVDTQQQEITIPTSQTSQLPPIYQPLQTHTNNLEANVPQPVNTQYQQQDQPFPIPQVSQTPPLGQVRPLQGPAQELQLIPVPPKQRKRKKPSLYIALIAVLALVIIGGALLFNKGNDNPTGSSNNRVFFQDGTKHNDQLRINLQNITPTPNGQTYFAWLQETTQQTRPLGALPIQKGNVSFLYPGDGNHTNLISITQGILITTEDLDKTPERPSDQKVYQASFDPQFLDGLKYLLYATPGLPDQQSIIAVLQDTLHSIDDKAGSIVETLNQDNAQAMRQATRIIELLDNSQQARSSGDLPDKHPSQISVAIGLLSSPSQQGYLDILDAQLKQLEPLVADNPNAKQHLTNIKSALSNLRDWLQKMHDYAVQLLKAADLQDPGTSAIALQLKRVAADSFTGRTIPPDTSPQPKLGSAGARQAYAEAQYMATLFLQPA